MEGFRAPPRGAVAGLRKTVGPGVEERDPSRASRRHGGFEVLYAPQNLHAPVANRGAEHPVAGQEDRLEIARSEGANSWLVQEAWPSGRVPPHFSSSLLNTPSTNSCPRPAYQ